MGALSLPPPADNPTSFQTLFGTKPRRYLTRKQALQVKADAEAGMTVEELMKKYGVSIKPIRRILGGQLERRRPDKRTAERTRRLRRLLRLMAWNRMSIKEAAERVGITTETAYQYINSLRVQE